MQVRLDTDIARFVLRNAEAYQRMFLRRKSHAAIVNEMLRDVIRKNEKQKEPHHD